MGFSLSNDFFHATTKICYDYKQSLLFSFCINIFWFRGWRVILFSFILVQVVGVDSDTSFSYQNYHTDRECVPGRFKACPLGPAKLSLGQVGSEGVG